LNLFKNENSPHKNEEQNKFVSDFVVSSYADDICTSLG